MTVREMIELLGEFDDDAEIVIGEQQRYGNDFAYDINDVTEQIYEGFWYGEGKVVSINLGRQMGYIDYSADVDDYEEDY